MRTRRFAAGFVVALLCFAAFETSSSLAFTGETTHAYCGTGNCWAFHAWAESSCGACTTIGTGWTSTLPTSVLVQKDAYDQDVMDEGVWLISGSHPTTEATEAGYVAGFWPYASPPTWLGDNLYPYGTKNNGGSITDGQRGAVSMAKGAAVEAWAYGSGTTAQVDQNGTAFWSYTGFPSFTTPRFNFAQGEVHATDCDSSGNNCDPWPWLNNCSPGEEFTLEYETSAGTWEGWSSISVDAYSPYWVTDIDADHFSNGGGYADGCP
jgi:hypothetical protein